jgi:hypothetical protein
MHEISFIMAVAANPKLGSVYISASVVYYLQIMIAFWHLFV